MKTSRRARRMLRQQQRARGSGKLNLVSLMDIFTILVFFLMVNSSEVEVLPADRNIKLPESVSTQKPAGTLLLSVDRETIKVGGDPVSALVEVDTDLDEPIPELVASLVAHHGADSVEARVVTVMGDREIPFRLLKRILASCAAADFNDVALAVNGRELPPLEAGT